MCMYLRILLPALLLWTIFIFPTAEQLIRYPTYSHFVSPNQVIWTIKPIHDELWRPSASFSYTVDGKKYQKQEIFQGGRYRTPYAAEEAIKELKNQPLVVWYSPQNPQEGTLEKFFPLKKLIYSLTTLLLVFYIAWFGKKQWKKQ